MKNIAIITGIILIILLPILTYSFMSSSKKSTPNTLPTSAVIKTTLGDMTVELYGDKAPETVTNFVTLAKEGKYNNVPFHRIIPEFMVQTGDFENQNGTGGHSYKGVGTSIPDEFAPGLSHTKGTLSMANRGPNTGGSQFFIVHAEATPWLDGMHAIFGKVTKGLDVLDKLATVETDLADRPLEPIEIISVEVK
jgi:cyclophilin family peptidyl-prolyl cis-trans isomerase